jgi:hypothetical protein
MQCCKDINIVTINTIPAVIPQDKYWSLRCPIEKLGKTSSDAAEGRIASRTPEGLTGVKDIRVGSLSLQR